MKNFILFALGALLSLSMVQAQDVQFGVIAGYTNITAKADADDGFNSISVSADESGFFVGGLLDVSISETFGIQPELLYANAGDSGFLYIPVLAKFSLAETGFNLLAGPQANISLEESTPDTNSFGLDATFGASFDITENFFIEARYGLELTNRINGESDDVDVSGKVNTLQIGIGYAF